MNTRDIIDPLKEQALKYRAAAQAAALCSLQAERMEVNPPDAKKQREDAIYYDGMATAFETAANSVSLQLKVP